MWKQLKILVLVCNAAPTIKYFAVRPHLSLTIQLTFYTYSQIRLRLHYNVNSQKLSNSKFTVAKRPSSNENKRPRDHLGQLNLSPSVFSVRLLLGWPVALVTARHQLLPSSRSLSWKWNYSFRHKTTFHVRKQLAFQGHNFLTACQSQTLN